MLLFKVHFVKLKYNLTKLFYKIQILFIINLNNIRIAREN
jgi:hypothetical protein